ncbi:MAG TPA: histidine phosphatase family protein [Gemmatimonadaceae bacterium]
MTPDAQQRWPERLWIVRHGESAGNVARDAATLGGLELIDIAERDVDVPLSQLGHTQAAALGSWFAALPEESRPNVVFTSPYLRARETLDYIVRAGGVDTSDPPRIDERLREKEFGILDRLTRRGIEQRFPAQAAARDRVGKFYHRPPGGEAWTDVILRLRTFADTISLHYSRPGCRVLVVAHQVIVLCMRYLIEEMDEATILAIDARGDVANCGVTEYELEDGTLAMAKYNFTAPLEREGAPVTAAPDTPSAAK